MSFRTEMNPLSNRIHHPVVDDDSSLRSRRALCRLSMLATHVSSSSSSSSSSDSVSSREGSNGLRHGFPRVVATARLFSRVLERVFIREEVVQPRQDLVELPKGIAPRIADLFGTREDASPSVDSTGEDDYASLRGEDREEFVPPSGHVCVVGPTGSGKSTIVRGVLCSLLERQSMSVYTLEFPVEVSMETHGQFHVCQVDMFSTVAGRQRSLQETANALLRHDPDLVYFGELRSKTDFETATSIALSGVACISTGHAHSPLDLLERLRAMNIDLSTQFRALRCIVGVKRIPILCDHCKRRVILRGRPELRSLRLLHMYRVTTFSRPLRRQVPPMYYIPGTPIPGSCSCTTGYANTHTVFEFLRIFPTDSVESLRARHSYTTEETLISLILQGRVNPLFLESSV